MYYYDYKFKNYNIKFKTNNYLIYETILSYFEGKICCEISNKNLNTVIYNVDIVVEESSDFTNILKRQQSKTVFECKVQNSRFLWNLKQRNCKIIIGAKDSKKQKLLFNIISVFLTEFLSRIDKFEEWFPFHASALEKKGKGVLIIGDPGAGKSTTALRLLNYGYRLISDDRPLINRNLYISSFHRPVFISKDALDTFDDLGYLSHAIINNVNSKKLTVPQNSIKEHISSNDAKLNKVIFLHRGKYDYNDSVLFSRKLSQIDTMLELIKSLSPYYEKSEMFLLMDICEKISCLVPAYRVCVSKSTKWIDDLIYLIDNT